MGGTIAAYHILSSQHKFLETAEGKGHHNRYFQLLLSFSVVSKFLLLVYFYVFT